jgi:ubiquinone/menaquinone biosynthesis C-methylase UbiE
MQRIPEPDLMLEDDQAKAYAEADFTQPHQQFIDHLVTRVPQLSSSGTALDLGCGPADIAIRFAQRFSQWQVHGIDGSAAMLHYGQRAIAQSQLQARITLIHGYLTTEPNGFSLLDNTQYQLIFSNSLLHHLQDPITLWRSLHRWGTGSTPALIMDLLRPETEAIAQAMVNDYAADEPTVLQRDFYHSLLAAYRMDEIEMQLQREGFSQFVVEQVSDRHWLAWGCC